jgi:hypothetical protein
VDLSALYVTLPQLARLRGWTAGHLRLRFPAAFDGAEEGVGVGGGGADSDPDSEADTPPPLLGGGDDDDDHDDGMPALEEPVVIDPL